MSRHYQFDSPLLTQKKFLICAQKQRGKKLNSLQQTKGVSVHQMILLDYA